MLYYIGIQLASNNSSRYNYASGISMEYDQIIMNNVLAFLIRECDSLKPQCDVSVLILEVIPWIY
jgi:hypothetical protein